MIAHLPEISKGYALPQIYNDVLGCYIPHTVGICSDSLQHGQNSNLGEISSESGCLV